MQTKTIEKKTKQIHLRDRSCTFFLGHLVHPRSPLCTNIYLWCHMCYVRVSRIPCSRAHLDFIIEKRKWWKKKRERIKGIRVERAREKMRRKSARERYRAHTHVHVHIQNLHREKIVHAHTRTIYIRTYTWTHTYTRAM